MELFYAEPESIRDDLATLDDFERKHVHTLRKKEGEIIHFTDGMGHHYAGTIATLKPRLTVQITQKENIPVVSPTLTLACAFIKQNRLDFILEKGTELGVGHFIIFRSDYSNYFSANQARFKKIIRQALKQSLHFYFPSLTFLQSFQEFLTAARNFEIKLAAIDRTYPALKEVVKAIEPKQALLLAIGPEGGFSASEISELEQNGFRGFSLGTNRLRSETAAISAISFIKQYI